MGSLLQQLQQMQESFVITYQSMVKIDSLYQNAVVHAVRAVPQIATWRLSSIPPRDTPPTCFFVDARAHISPFPWQSQMQNDPNAVSQASPPPRRFPPLRPVARSFPQPLTFPPLSSFNPSRSKRRRWSSASPTTPATFSSAARCAVPRPRHPLALPVARSLCPDLLAFP